MISKGTNRNYKFIRCLHLILRRFCSTNRNQVANTIGSTNGVSGRKKVYCVYVNSVNSLTCMGFSFRQTLKRNKTVQKVYYSFLQVLFFLWISAFTHELCTGLVWVSYAVSYTYDRLCCMNSFYSRNLPFNLFRLSIYFYTYWFCNL